MAWLPFLSRDINILKNVQRAATRMVQGMVGLTYDERLARLNLFSLKYRRKGSDLVVLYKILHGQLTVNFSVPLQFEIDPRTRGHALWLLKP